MKNKTMKFRALHTEFSRNMHGHLNQHLNVYTVTPAMALRVYKMIFNLN